MSAMMMGQAGAATASGGTTVTVSGASIDHNDPTGATAGIRFTSSGTTSKLLGASWTQISGSTDWIIPHGDASSQYEVRATTGGTVPSGPALNVWHDLGTTRAWTISASMGDVAGFSILIEVRFNPGSPGPVLDSANYNCTANAV